jgi:hypothetical protein
LQNFWLLSIKTLKKSKIDSDTIKSQEFFNKSKPKSKIYCQIERYSIGVSSANYADSSNTAA